MISNLFLIFQYSKSMDHFSISIDYGYIVNEWVNETERQYNEHWSLSMKDNKSICLKKKYLECNFPTDRWISSNDMEWLREISNFRKRKHNYWEHEVVVSWNVSWPQAKWVAFGVYDLFFFLILLLFNAWTVLTLLILKSWYFAYFIY